MNKAKSVRNSLLSILCVASWLIISGRILKSLPSGNNDLVSQFIGAWLITVLIAITGGVVLLFYGLLIKQSLKYSFTYNLFATSNTAVGIFGMILHLSTDRPTPYLVAASFALGIIMYKNIFATRKSLQTEI
jgi:hypothetical protein